MSKPINFEVGLQDLLFSGASSFILLFFIFSIKMGGESMKNNVNAKGGVNSFYGRSSLVDEYYKEGSMKSIRIVEISGLSEEVFERLKLKPEIGRWDLSNYSLEERTRIGNQVFSMNRKISYILITDSLKSSQIDFHVNSKALGKIKENDKIVKIRAKIIEGESILFSKNAGDNSRFDGFIASPMEDIDLVKNIKVSFQVDKVDRTHRLFQFNQN